MKCPVDDTVLAISDRQGIEIDYCPTCRGVWLYRGELDKLIERESRWVEDQVRDAAPRASSKPAKSEKPKPEKPGQDEAPKKKKKPMSFLQDLMELGQQ